MGLKFTESTNEKGEKGLKFNEVFYSYGDILLKFIYTDYTPIYQKMLKILKETNSKKETLDKLNNEELFSYLINLLKKIISSKEAENNDPIYLLIFYELFVKYSNLNYDSDCSKEIEFIKNFPSIILKLQDFYYEALNICFNRSYKFLRKLPINARLDYYSHFEYSINVLTHLANEQYIIAYPTTLKELNKDAFNEDKNYVDDIYNYLDCYSTSTNVEFRKDKPYYDRKNKVIKHTVSNNYNLTHTTNYVIERIKQKKYKEPDCLLALNFNNISSLCSYEFYKLIEKREKFSIQECKLCNKLFIKRINSKKEYCDNIFEDNKPCSQIGRRIINEINKNNDNIENLYNKIYKKIWNRANNYNKDKEFLKTIQKLNKAYTKRKISSNEFQNCLEEFEKIKKNSFEKNNLSSETIKILDKM